MVHNAQKLVGTTVKNYWKLRAIDTLGEANNNTTSKEERSETIELMTGNLRRSLSGSGGHNAALCNENTPGSCVIIGSCSIDSIASCRCLSR
ncbi:MAG: hypothetical protein WAZ77_20795 [Candidatus Nitrosopolaris sp.]